MQSGQLILFETMWESTILLYCTIKTRQENHLHLYTHVLYGYESQTRHQVKYIILILPQDGLHVEALHQWKALKLTMM